MNLHQTLAERWEATELPSLRAVFGSRYRELIGVEPSQCQEFRAALESIRAGTRMSVSDVVEQLRLKHQLNGLVPGEEAAGAGKADAV